MTVTGLAARVHRATGAASASPVGLLSEMSAATTGDLVDKIPQALSHLTHIRAAAALRTAETS